MENIILQKQWVQGAAVVPDDLRGTAFTGENGAHTFRVTGIDANQDPVAITGTITGKFLAANNVTVPLTGSIDNGAAVLTLTEDCYAVPGRFIVSIFATNDNTTLCIYCGVGNVFRTESSIVAYPSASIPDIQTLIDEAQAVSAQVPGIVSAAQTAVDGIEAQKDTMIASIASVAGQGTDTTLTQSGVAADAKAAGDQISDLKSAFDSVYTVKNLLPIGTITKTVNGVDVVYADGTIALDGTPSTTGGRLNHIVDLTLPAGKYTLYRKEAYMPTFIQKTSDNSILLNLSNNAYSGTFTLGETTECYLGINVENKTYSASNVMSIQLEQAESFTEYVKPSEGSAIDRNLAKRVAKIYGTYAELIADTTLTAGEYVQTLGYYAPNDGGEGLFVIKSAVNANDTWLYYTLNNGLYADCITDEIVLPRYGGQYVNDMVDNAKPFMRRYQRNKVVLPTPNANHPACGYYTESATSKKTYYWKTDDIILIDENFSYSDIYLNGEISATAEIDAIMKISDSLKPEDICFVTPVRLSGYHYDGTFVYPDTGLLIEGCARVNFVSSLQIGYVGNCIVLGGTNHKNPIEFFGNIIEIGSCLEKAFVIDAAQSKTTYFNIKSLIIQNPLADDVVGIYARGAWTQSNIESLQMYFSGDYLDTSKAFDIAGDIFVENTLHIGTCRISAGLFGDITYGIYNIDTFCGGLSNDTKACNFTNHAYMYSKSWSVRNSLWYLVVDSTSLFETEHAYYNPTVTGNNVKIGGYIYGDPSADFIKWGVAYSPTSGKLSLFRNGSVLKTFTPDA